MDKDNKTTSSDPRSPQKTRLVAPMAGVVMIGLIALVWLYGGSQTVSSNSNTDPTVQATDQKTPDPPKGKNTSGPVIYFPEPEFDFGNISQGDKVSHVFVVQNKGDEPLKLIKAKGS